MSFNWWTSIPTEKSCPEGPERQQADPRKHGKGSPFKMSVFCLPPQNQTNIMYVSFNHQRSGTLKKMTPRHPDAELSTIANGKRKPCTSHERCPHQIPHQKSLGQHRTKKGDYRFIPQNLLKRWCSAETTRKAKSPLFLSPGTKVLDLVLGPLVFWRRISKRVTRRRPAISGPRASPKRPSGRHARPAAAPAAAVGARDQAEAPILGGTERGTDSSASGVAGGARFFFFGWGGGSYKISRCLADLR